MFDYDIDPKYDPQRNVPDPGWQQDERYHVPPRLGDLDDLRAGFRKMFTALQERLHAEELDQAQGEARRLRPFANFLRGQP